MTVSLSSPVQPTGAAELGDRPRTLAEVERAVRSFQKREFDACLRQLAGAVKAHPELPPPHALFAKPAFLGNLYTRECDLYTRECDQRKAGEWMDDVKVALESLKVWTAVAFWLLEGGRDGEARAQVDAAARLDPKFAEVRRMLGLAARQRKDFAAAAPIFQALSAESPADAWARNQWALVLAEQPDDAKKRRALELAELSVRQDPNAVDALTTLGTVYYRIKRLDDAEKVLGAVVGSGKGNSDAAYMLALADRGQTEGATALIRTALTAPGLFVFRNDAQQWLDRQPSKAR